MWWLPSTRNWFAWCWEEPEACAEFPEGRDGPKHMGRAVGHRRGWEIPLPGACGTVAPAFLWVWVRGGCSTCMETSVPSPIWPRSHWESRERTRERDHKPQLLRKPVSGKKPAMHLTCPDAFSLPTCLPAPAGWSRHCVGTAEVTSQLCATLGMARSCERSILVTKLISGPAALGWSEGRAARRRERFAPDQSSVLHPPALEQ